MDAIVIVRQDSTRSPMRMINNVPFLYYVLDSLVVNYVKNACIIVDAKLENNIKNYFGNKFKKINLGYCTDILMLRSTLNGYDEKIAVVDSNVILKLNFAQIIRDNVLEIKTAVAVLSGSYFASNYIGCMDCCVDASSDIFMYKHDNSCKYRNCYTTGIYFFKKDKLINIWNKRSSLEDVLKDCQLSIYGYVYIGSIVTSEMDTDDFEEIYSADVIQAHFDKEIETIISSGIRETITFWKFDIYYIINLLLMFSISACVFYKYFAEKTKPNIQDILLFWSVFCAFNIIMYSIHYYCQERVYVLKNNYKLKYLKQNLKRM